MQYIHYYNSPLGQITEASDGYNLTGLWFSGQKYSKNLLEEGYLEGHLPVFDETDQWLEQYFLGKIPSFTPAIRLNTTPFRKAVYEELLSIPYGQTTTYGEIASMIATRNGSGKMSAQAVGGAVGHNPIAIIIPCHRVVGAGGKLTGYAGGLDRKEKLLLIEKANERTYP